MTSNMDLTQFSLDLCYNLFNYTKPGTIANNSASGLFADKPKELLKHAVTVPYYCSKEDIKSICTALNNRIVYPDFKYKTTHPAIKFLSEYLMKDILKLNFRDNRIKIVGAKLNKDEAKLRTTQDVHFCFLNPETEDHYRAQESVNVIYNESDKLEATLKANYRQIDAIYRTIEKSPTSEYSNKMREQAIELYAENNRLEREKNQLQDYHSSLTSTDSSILKHSCNVGVEECDEKCDIVLAFDSFYDVDLKAAFDRFNKCEVQTVYMTLILPFGLLYVDTYYSDELGVYFRKIKNNGKTGFIMTHKDLSNGYIHNNSSTVFQLMNSSFVETESGNWVCEIVDNIAEICLMKFTRSMNQTQSVRKMLPRKFDKYTIILNPIHYFGPFRRSIPMMVDKNKLQALIAYAGREENLKQDKFFKNMLTYAHSLFMSVIVGSTTLQEGGELHDQVIYPMVIYAIISSMYHFDTFQLCMKNSRPRGFIKSIFSAANAEWKSIIEKSFPRLYKFFTATRVEKFLLEKIELQDLILVSNVKLESTYRKIVKLFNAMNHNDYEVLIDSMPSAAQIYNEGGSVFEVIKTVINNNKELYSMTYDSLFNNQKYQRKFNGILARKYKVNDYNVSKSAVKIKRIVEYLESHEDTIEWNEAWYQELHGCAIGAEGEKLIEQIHSFEISKNNSLPTHDPTRNLKYDDSRMSDLSMAALNFNISRLDENKKIKKIGKKQLPELIKILTKPGEEMIVNLNLDDVYESLKSLRDNYITTITPIPEGNLFNIKEKVIQTLKTIMKNGQYQLINGKKLYIRNGKAGCGKTKYVIDNWVEDKDGYVVPFANTCLQTNDALKIKFGDSDFAVKTYEKVTELIGDKCGGGTLYIDEAGVLNKPFIYFIMAATSYSKYVLIGDEEQTGSVDHTGLLDIGMFTNINDQRDKVEQCYYTFRFGPTTAAFLNYNYNYPVYSLADHDTIINIKDLGEINEQTTGTIITISGDNEKYYAELVKNDSVMTAKKSQGITLPKVNFVLRDGDAAASLSYRSNSIVAASRATAELDIYVDLVAKNSKAVANMRAFHNNYSTLFNVQLANKADF